MEYPRELVHRYGAKAGLLMHVAKYLPDIPQVAMVVNEPGEPIDDFLRRADRVPILYPRLFRSSAVAELDGYEGDFPTELVLGFEEGYRNFAGHPNYHGMYRNKAYFERGIRDLVAKIQQSPKDLKALDYGLELPDEINVIIAEQSPSEYFGTLIKHPNRNDYFWMTITKSSSQQIPRDEEDDDPERSTYEYTSETGAKRVPHFSVPDITDSQLIKNDLSTVSSWHDRIATLPKMDPYWTYQLEFGIDPPCLYQVRPFKPISEAGFKLENNATDYKVNPLVVGTTSPDGIYVYAELDVLGRYQDGEKINPKRNPTLLYDELRRAGSIRYLPNYQAGLFFNAWGSLAHQDVQAMRKGLVVALFPIIDDSEQYLIMQGDLLNIISDGINIKVTNLTADSQKRQKPWYQ